jgi:hemerythrin-like domain-containing protein
MKRAAALLGLSREHHEALVLARRACEPDRPQAEPAALRLHLLQRWREHFEPHFALEEAVLLPALEQAGCSQAAGQARADHARLRALVERLRAGELACLPDWGAAMHAHVKWEERELFPLAEQVLDLQALERGLQRKESP